MRQRKKAKKKKNRNNEKKSFNLIAHTTAKNNQRLFVRRLKNFIEGKYLMCISDNYFVRRRHDLKLQRDERKTIFVTKK